jgi:hypothetical protein
MPSRSKQSSRVHVVCQDFGKITNGAGPRVSGLSKAPKPVYILTIRDIGYRFESDTQEVL